MTPEQRYTSYLDRFGEELSPAAGRRAARPLLGLRRRLALVAIAVPAVAAAVLALVLLAPAGVRLDAAARADAALAPPGRIVYLRLTTTPVATVPGMHVPPPQTTETWSAQDPMRWRVVQAIPSSDHVIDGEGRLYGREEFSYAHGSQRTYNARRDELKVVTGFDDHSNAVRLRSSVPLDPDRDLRPLLARGQLRDTGETTVRGRRVRRLVGETTTHQGAIRRDRIVYDVDADTFEPVGGSREISIVLHGTRDPRMLTFRTDFRVDAYERLPDDAAHAHLLQIQTTPHTKVVRRTVAQLHARARAMRRR